MSEKESLFSAKNRQLLLGPLSKNNPVIVQILGICSALAVTAKLEPAIVMGIAVTAVTAFSNVILSLLRNTIPNRIRIIVQLVVVAALVIIIVSTPREVMVPPEMASTSCVPVALPPFFTRMETNRSLSKISFPWNWAWK